MRIPALLPRATVLAGLAAAGLLTGCGSMQQYSSLSLPGQDNVGGILKFAYDTPTPTTAYDTGSGSSSGDTVADESNDSNDHGINSIALLQSLRRGDGQGGGGYSAQLDQASTTPRAPRIHVDAQAEHAYLSASLARLSTFAAPVQQPSNVATVTEMPDFTHMPVDRPVVLPIDVQP
ncbi:hypothetical protein KDW40_19130 [Burkholderia cenocepacia]|uniref:hypothetical protein n=1 Tax=Burkholderia cenocepacia TaxID=95486 RepID=UPI001BA179A5|nr:hypothetical protein [Burkholderia cenocepacia]MBR8043469.1 hypothetical protein [Burkholderia cenocepacia]MBR8327845.1 hypothetical protein [Burkholderia cenocepacia]